VEFTLDAEGMPTPRPRFNGKIAYMPKRYKDYQHKLVNLIKEKNLKKCDFCKIHITFHVMYPKSTPKYKKIDGLPLRLKFDVDNLAKGVMDALEKAELVEDDRQFYQLKVDKYRTTGTSKIQVKLWEC
jgi:Holliday junction resolvase RusA-like endonuclease|tara:strand:- start:975 stop:1358 length:384 start_codon:yes stop_codon:yes gene_type:complete